MPQGLGKNLYLELSVYDNVDFMAQLFGLSSAERPVRVKELLAATGLAPFAARPAGKLSGGMKQKVGYAARSSTTQTCSFSMSQRPASIHSRGASFGR